MNENKEKKIKKCKYSHIHFDGTTSCVEAGWEDDKVTKTDEARCEACEKYKSRYIEYPITVNKIDVKPIEYDSWHCKTGDLVAVRPCGEKYEKKTYLGFYLGDLPKAIWPTFNSKDGVLSIGTMSNPAMFVPELGEIIWGCGSWWHKVKSEKELREITDKDINDTWYVKLAHQLQEKERANRPEGSVTLKEGDMFQQAWQGVKEPLAFRVLSIDRPNNSLRVKCMGRGYTHEEEWDDLDTTEIAFSTGEYKMLEAER